MPPISTSTLIIYKKKELITEVNRTKLMVFKPNPTEPKWSYPNETDNTWFLKGFSFKRIQFNFNSDHEVSTTA